MCSRRSASLGDGEDPRFSNRRIETAAMPIASGSVAAVRTPADFAHLAAERSFDPVKRPSALHEEGQQHRPKREEGDRIGHAVHVPERDRRQEGDAQDERDCPGGWAPPRCEALLGRRRAVLGHVLGARDVRQQYAGPIEHRVSQHKRGYDELARLESGALKDIAGGDASLRARAFWERVR
eukprot:scaffold12181_cov213-Isochrysis_galbana.AAC.8